MAGTCRVDLPGHGKAVETRLSVEAAADFITALLDAAGLKTAALVGHSWGSLIALQVASTQSASATWRWSARRSR
jgi:pimeloyl-ACP methyl ester carboxylesterase